MPLFGYVVNEDKVSIQGPFGNDAAFRAASRGSLVSHSVRLHADHTQIK